MDYPERTTRGGGASMISDAVVPQRDPQINQAMQRLTRVLDRMEKTLAMHVDRIQTVMRPAAPENNRLGTMKEMPDEILCELARAITERARHIEGLCDKVDEISARLEL